MPEQQTNPEPGRSLAKTSTPGVYKRGGRYVVVYRDRRGKQRKAFAHTLAEARDVKARHRIDRHRGEETRDTFAAYAARWIATYQGRTRRGISENTLGEYRRALGLDEQGEPLERDGEAVGAVAFFGRMRLRDIRPLDVREYAAELQKRGLAAGTVRLQIAPLRAMFATAVEDGDLSVNPAAGVRVAGRRDEDAHEEAEKAKALSEDELRALLAATAPEWRLLVEFLAGTGLRVSEAAGLAWRHLDLGRQRVRVRRRYRNGRFGQVKSDYARRDVPLSPGMARRLWALRKERKAADGRLVFGSGDEPLDRYAALRAVKAAGKRAGVPWVGLHTLRHTCASILFARGLNAKQVQAWLGHHAASFTLDTYIHLIDSELPDAAFFDEFAPVEGESEPAGKDVASSR